MESELNLTSFLAEGEIYTITAGTEIKLQVAKCDYKKRIIRKARGFENDPERSFIPMTICACVQNSLCHNVKSSL